MSRRIARKLKRKKTQKKMKSAHHSDSYPNQNDSSNDNGNSHKNKLNLTPNRKAAALQTLQKSAKDASPYLDSSPTLNNKVTPIHGQHDAVIKLNIQDEKDLEIAHLHSHEVNEDDNNNDSDINHDKARTPDSSVASSVESMVTPVPAASLLESAVLYNNNGRSGRYSDDESLSLLNNSIKSSKENSVEIGLDGSTNPRKHDILNHQNTQHGVNFGRAYSVQLESMENDKLAPQNKRRRSSVVAPPSMFGLPIKPSLKHETSLSSITVPKKKKKLLKPATLSLNKKSIEKKLSVKDLRDLVLYVLESKNNSPAWVHIENKTNIQKVITLFVPGIQPQDIVTDLSVQNSGMPLLFADLLGSASQKLNVQPKFLTPEIPRELTYIQAPGSKNSIYSPYNSFVNVGLNKLKKLQIKEELSKKQITINDLLLNVGELNEASYPIHPKTANMPQKLIDQIVKRNALLPQSEEWVDTCEFAHDAPHIFALDCEMCFSENGHVLTRCSIVDFNNRVVYDQLVKPAEKIVDYLTKYSGITEEMLSNVDYTHKQVQQDILKIISCEDILIGHSLQSDLNILKIRHTKIVDTAFIYEHKAGPPFRPSLKYLSQEYLSIQIQNDDLKGHDSITDAQTCMELTKLKIQNGLAFGLGLNTESLFKKLSESSNIKSVVLTDYAPDFSYDGEANKDNCKNIKCASDDAIINTIIETINEHDFFVGRLRDLEFERGYVQRKNVPCLVDQNDDRKPEEKPDVIQKLRERLSRLYESIPTSTLIILYTGTGDVTKFKEISSTLHAITIKEKREEAQRLRQDELSESVRIARDAMAAFIIKD